MIRGGAFRSRLDNEGSAQTRASERNTQRQSGQAPVTEDRNVDTTAADMPATPGLASAAVLRLAVAGTEVSDASEDSWRVEAPSANPERLRALFDFLDEDRKGTIAFQKVLHVMFPHGGPTDGGTTDGGTTDGGTTDGRTTDGGTTDGGMHSHPTHLHPHLCSVLSNSRLHVHMHARATAHVHVNGPRCSSNVVSTRHPPQLKWHRSLLGLGRRPRSCRAC